MTKEVKHFSVDGGCKATLDLEVTPLHEFLGTTPQPDDLVKGFMAKARLNCGACEIKNATFQWAGYEAPEIAMGKASQFLSEKCKGKCQ